MPSWWVTLLALVLPTAAQAQFNYMNDNGSITITGYTGPGGDVMIPGTINGLPVTRIGNRAFFSVSTITSVDIPDSVTSIEDNAFRGCGLTNVVIGNNVTKIGSSAFAYCSGLTSLIIPDNVTSIGDEAFRQCGLSSVTIPNNVPRIGVNGFYGCIWMTHVTLGSNVTSIGFQAFANCTSLTNVILPDNLKSIGSSAFLYCRSLTSVTIPDGVDNIGSTSFDYCTSLSAISVDPLNPVFSSLDGVLFDKVQTSILRFPQGKAGSYAIPGSVTAVGDATFAFCTGLTNVIIHNSVVTIGYLAFEGCTSLTDMVIPRSVTNIGGSGGGLAFGNCTSLSAITVDPLNPVFSSLDGVLFDKVQTSILRFPQGKAGSYTIPNSVTHIGGSVNSGVGEFSGCSRLTSVIIPSSIVRIENNTFRGCASLSSVTIPESVMSIGFQNFVECPSLTAVYFQGNAPSASGDQFDGDPLVTVYYLPGTTGWGSTFAGAPAVRRNPLTEPPGFRAGEFGFGISGPPNSVLVIEASASLSVPEWRPVSTNTLNSTGASSFSDPLSTSYPTRLYRFRAP